MVYSSPPPSERYSSTRLLMRVSRVRVEERFHPRPITRVGNAQRHVRRPDTGGLRRNLFVDRAALCQRVGDLAECGLHRLLIGRHRRLLRRAGIIDIAPQPSAIEQRQRYRRRAGIGEAAPREESAQRGADRPQRRGQGDAREQSRSRRAYIGILCDQLMLGLQHVGPTQQDLGRQARGQHLQRGIAVAQPLRQQHGDVVARALIAGFRLPRFQFGGDTDAELGPRQLQRLLERLQRLLRDAQLVLIRPQGRPGRRDLGDQTDPRGALRLFRREILF
ncbi:hypothetical protein WR25_01120 [Diploscapter pachys]|uniref:Uncharacterized protein n=1 Tax=Diploscapter pachys TaxID=2018661 RepID=A0A2A2K7P5_9BILA|nr:hypothetical protein WR25_01120 [Diploscapter pachys]